MRKSPGSRGFCFSRGRERGRLARTLPADAGETPALQIIYDAIATGVRATRGAIGVSLPCETTRLRPLFFAA